MHPIRLSGMEGLAGIKYVSRWHCANILGGIENKVVNVIDPIRYRPDGTICTIS